MHIEGFAKGNKEILVLIGNEWRKNIGHTCNLSKNTDPTGEGKLNYPRDNLVKCYFHLLNSNATSIWNKSLELLIEDKILCKHEALWHLIKTVAFLLKNFKTLSKSSLGILQKIQGSQSNPLQKKSTLKSYEFLVCTFFRIFKS